MKRVVVAGCRDLTDKDLVFNFLDKVKLNFSETFEVVCGCARGADTFGKEWALENGYPVKYFPADWKKYGNSAGPIRNGEMAKYATHVICFWDGKSRGTKTMIEAAHEYELPLTVVRY